MNARPPQENGQRQREQLASRIDGLVAILEERKQELVGLIGKEQDDKLKRVRALIRRHGDDLEAAVTLVESAIRSLEEPHMCVFVQVGSDQLYDKIVSLGCFLILTQLSCHTGSPSWERPCRPLCLHSPPEYSWISGPSYSLPLSPPVHIINSCSCRHNEDDGLSSALY